jgi:hypothetical protein
VLTLCKELVMDDQSHDKWLDIDEAVAYLRSRGVKITRTTLYSNVADTKGPGVTKSVELYASSHPI